MSPQQVTAINHFLCTGRVISPHVGETNRFVCTGEFLCNSLPSRQDLSPQDVADNQIILNVCMLLVAKINHVAETKICTKITITLRRILRLCIEMEQFAARSLRKTRLFLETSRFDTNSSCEIAQKFRSLRA